MSLEQTLTKHLLEQHFKGEAPENFDSDYDLIENQVMDSLAMIELITFLENAYGIEFDTRDFVPEHFQSVNAIAAFVTQKQT